MNHYVSELEERVASRLLGVVEELAHGCDMPDMFRVWKDGQVWAVPPDKVEGVFEAIKLKFQAMRPWSLLDGAREDAREARAQVGHLTVKLALAERRIALLEQQYASRYQVEPVVRQLLEDYRKGMKNAQSRFGRRRESLEQQLLFQLCEDLTALIGRPMPTVVKERMKRSIWHLKHARTRKEAKTP